MGQNLGPFLSNHPTDRVELMAAIEPDERKRVLDAAAFHAYGLEREKG